MIYDARTRELLFANAGHHPALLYRRSAGRLDRLDADGLPIGLEKTATYSQKRTRLDSGDSLLLFTDGVVEALDERHQQYTQERLEAVFVHNVAERPDVIVDNVRKSIDEFVGRATQHDDMTLVTLQAANGEARK